MHAIPEFNYNSVYTGFQKTINGIPGKDSNVALLNVSILTSIARTLPMDASDSFHFI